MSTNVKLNDRSVIINNQDVVDQLDITRLKHFKKVFQERTETDVQYLVQAPGRVNIIGDHIDYHGFAVLPMAIENCVWLGCSFASPKDGDSKGQINISNADQESYETFTSNHSLLFGPELDKSHKWYHYILCGYHGVLASRLLNIDAKDVSRLSKDRTVLASADQQLANLRSLNIVVQSNLPPASGLSSSSALVCASAISTELLLQKPAQEIHISSRRLAEDCSKFEHLVGTHGGGMDQAVIMTAQNGFAKYVQFMPNLDCKNVCLPKDIVWLVSHCGSNCVKAATTGFNTRVLETKLTAALIVEAYDDQSIVIDRTITLGKVMNQLFVGLSTSEIVEALKTKVFDREELRLRMPLRRLAESFETSEEVLLDLLGHKERLLSRCEHVFEEAERVDRFKSICETSCDIEQLGQLMTQSHYSLRDKYDCSHPALDNLVQVALDAGALGARLTGAGWGGCVVAMVHHDKCDHVLGRLKQVSNFTFRTEPRAGCSIIQF